MEEGLIEHVVRPGMQARANRCLGQEGLCVRLRHRASRKWRRRTSRDKVCPVFIAVLFFLLVLLKVLFVVIAVFEDVIAAVEAV